MTWISYFDQHDNKYKEKLKKYASLNWAEHLEKIPHASWPPRVSRIALLSLSARSQSLLIMAFAYYESKYPWYRRMMYENNNSIDDVIRRPHCYTALRGFHQLTKLLISRGTGVNKYITQEDLDEGLRQATNERKECVVKLFLDNGAQMHKMDCLETAAGQGDTAIVALLLDYGAETNAHADKLESALRAALWAGHLDVIKLLVDRGTDVNSAFKKSQYYPRAMPFDKEAHVADCLRFLFDNGAGVDLNADCSLTSAFFAPIFCGYREILQLLIDRGANVNELAGQNGYLL